MKDRTGMKITFVGHASILIETDGIAILSDPWWRGPCFGAQWWTYPPPATEVLEQVKPDYIYISHGHHDHLHPGTLKSFSRDTTILLAASTKMGNFIRQMGFKVIEFHDDEIALGSSGVKCRIIPTYSDDTLMVLRSADEVCININDALHSAPLEVQNTVVSQLRAAYPVIDYVFCGYGTASHFPNCYVVPGKDSVASARRRQLHFTREWAKLMAALQPRFGFPFAADVVFLETDLQWANEAVHNALRPTAVFKEMFPASPVHTIDIAPGFVIENGAPRMEKLWEPMVLDTLRSDYSEQIARANRYGNISDDSVEEVTALLRKSVDDNAEYLRSGDHDFRFLICFRNSAQGVLIEKRKQDIAVTNVNTVGEARPQFDIMYTSRVAYIKNSLTQRYGHEILFVGSGGIFEYANQRLVKFNLHRDFQRILRKPSGTPQKRYGASSKYAFKAKETIKKILGRKAVDLYDLDSWTVYDTAKQ